jgi:prepilin-type N-terminal cleavage/methylation domain-containing protein
MGSQRAFTLVEVLVVSAIIAIMAAVAIPAYSNYVSSQRKAVVKGLAETGAVSANIFLRRNRRSPSSAELRATMFFPDPARFTVEVDSPLVRIIDNSVTPPVSDTARFE